MTVKWQRQTVLALAALLGALPTFGPGTAAAAWPGRDGTVLFTGSKSGPEGEGREGSSLRSFRFGVPDTFARPTGNRTDRDPAVSPDGRTLAFVREVGPNPAGAPGDPAIFVMPLPGGRARQLTDPGNGLGVSEPAFSASGRRILFTVSRGATENGDDIYSIGVDGGGLRRLTRGQSEDSAAAMSPDGRQIVFVRTRLRGPGGELSSAHHVFSMRPDGRGIRDLTPDLRFDRPAADPDFSPDSGRIALSVGVPESQIFLMDRDGTHLRAIRCPCRPLGPSTVLLSRSASGFAHERWTSTHG